MGFLEWHAWVCGLDTWRHCGKAWNVACFSLSQAPSSTPPPFNSITHLHSTAALPELCCVALAQRPDLLALWQGEVVGIEVSSSHPAKHGRVFQL